MEPSSELPGVRPAGKNMATTTDGARYNKLQRPDVFPTAPPPRSPVQEIKGSEKPIIAAEVLSTNGRIDEENGNGNNNSHGNCSRITGGELVGEATLKSSKYNQHARTRQLFPVDIDTGMKGALPVPEDGDGDGFSQGESRDAVRYLRMVRDEAFTIPHVIAVPRTPPPPEEELYDENIYGDSRGYYADGAYISAPPIGPNLPDYDEYYEDDEWWDDEEEEEVPVFIPPSLTPQEAYTETLLTRFYAQRAFLRNPPPAEAAMALHSTAMITVPRKTESAIKAWAHAVEYINPSPVQLATMGNHVILRLLNMACQSLSSRNVNLSLRYGAWVWALLASLDERLLFGEDISELRRFARRAAWMSGASVGAVDGDEDFLDDPSSGDEVAPFTEPATTAAGERNTVAPDLIEAGKEAPSRGRLVKGAKKRGRRNTSSPSPRPKRAKKPPGPTTDRRNSNGEMIYFRENAETINRQQDFGSASQEEILPISESFDALPSSITDVEEAKARLLRKIAKGVEGEGEVAEGGEGKESRDSEHGQDGDVLDFNTKVTLDVIITIIGEVFGQRDLLGMRQQW
ncbi:hypothetical protein EJ08DRAFT_665326 [Tothia fuscella]|uniref:Uncharacterized protein n=1 Tax=Tothia fuscella TaxID=1048955 RepID=A0A9P4NH14_9PEZI|nr:hypothetical protein EJ08DRAFT_665326 [Tothia fuscella]